jgi:hypothetical protein
MDADGAELGRWPATAVAIRRFGKTAFEFVAEGDRLIFTPDDPAAFGDSPIAVGQDVDFDGRKRRRSKKGSDGTGPQPVMDEDSFEEQRSAAREAKQQPTRPRAGKRSRRHRTAAAEPAGPDLDRLDVAPDAPPAVTEPADTTVDKAPQPIDATLSDGPRERVSPEVDDTPSTKLTARTNRLWIRALDIARKYDTFGLDRVPIDANLRGREHQHTWDHRVAATSGLGQHICTICGAIRRKT